MKPELELTAEDRESMILDLLLNHGWICDRRVNPPMWTHPKTFLSFRLETAAKIAGVYPGVKIDSLHPFLQQIEKHVHDKAAMDGVDEGRLYPADPSGD